MNITELVHNLEHEDTRSLAKAITLVESKSEKTKNLQTNF